MRDFVSLFKKGDHVHNDQLVGEMVKPLLDWRVKSCSQSNRGNFEIDI